ncbi:MAG: hypothetical protein ACYDBH_22600 [Acidobacteriaceae bacterium]
MQHAKVPRESPQTGHLASEAMMGPAGRTGSPNGRCATRLSRQDTILDFAPAAAAKIQQGKRHNPALNTLARRHCDVLYALLRDGCASACGTRS